MLSDILNDQTLVPIGVAVTCTAAIAGLVWKVSAILSKHSEESRRAIGDLAHQFELFKQDMSAKLDRLNVDDHVTRSEMREFVAELRVVFPDKVIPQFPVRKD